MYYCLFPESWPLYKLPLCRSTNIFGVATIVSWGASGYTVAIKNKTKERCGIV